MTWRRLLVVLLAVAAGTALGVVSAAGGDQPLPPHTAAPPAVPASGQEATAPTDGARSPATPDWAGVLALLDRRREVSFARARAAPLAGACAPASPALRADRARVAELRRLGLKARGLRFDVVAVRARTHRAGLVELEVTDRRSAYRLVDADGRVRVRVPARDTARWFVRLAAGPAGWRYVRIDSLET